jgi:hypothetical protein
MELPRVIPRSQARPCVFAHSPPPEWAQAHPTHKPLLEGGCGSIGDQTPGPERPLKRLLRWNVQCGSGMQL